MARIDHVAPPAGPSDDDRTHRTWRRRLADLRAALHGRLWRSDEQFAADRGWTARRSASGWKITVRDPRFDLRQECQDCAGEGRRRISGAECEECGGTGVVTLDPPDEERS